MAVSVTHPIHLPHQATRSPNTQIPNRKRDEKTLRDDQRLRRLLLAAVAEADDESGWAPLGLVGSQIAKLSPEFDPRDWGFRKLSDLMRATGLFDLEERSDPDGRSRMLYVHPTTGRRDRIPGKKRIVLPT